MSKKHEHPLPESLGLPCVGADAHAHLDNPGLLENLPAVLERAKQSGVASIAQVFCGVDAYLAHKDAFADHPNIIFCLGVHPDDVAGFTGAVLRQMESLFHADPRLRAVGEIGLDLYHNETPQIVQEEAFRLQLDLAKTLDLPVVIHSRNAAPVSLKILESEGFAGRPLLWHCFSGDAVQYWERIVSNGWHISIPGPLTYSANEQIRAVVAKLPRDRLVVETDCPFLAPEPWRGRVNEPAFVAFTAQALAEARGESLAELWTTCGNTMRRFFHF